MILLPLFKAWGLLGSRERTLKIPKFIGGQQNPLRAPGVHARWKKHYCKCNKTFHPVTGEWKSSLMFINVTIVFNMKGGDWMSDFSTILASTLISSCPWRHHGNREPVRLTQHRYEDRLSKRGSSLSTQEILATHFSFVVPHLWKSAFQP